MIDYELRPISGKYRPLCRRTTRRTRLRTANRKYRRRELGLAGEDNTGCPVYRVTLEINQPLLLYVANFSMDMQNKPVVVFKLLVVILQTNRRFLDNIARNHIVEVLNSAASKL